MQIGLFYEQEFKIFNWNQSFSLSLDSTLLADYIRLAPPTQN
jgi:tRNA1(Val) A37 N6-methylase TrmN6